MVDLVADQKVVVKAINRMRKQAGLGRITKLRRGVPCSGHACPIAMSLEGITTSLSSTICGWTQPEFEAAQRVMIAVDTGKLPELELPRTVPMMKKHGDRKRTPIL